MKLRKVSTLLALMLASSFAAADIKIGVIASSTGPTAAVGIPQKNTVALLPTEIGGQKVEYIVLDDASDPTNAVTGVKKLISESKVDALIGPTTTPAALAILDFVAESKVPLVTTVGSSAVILPLDDKKRWVFKTTQNDDLIAAALIDHIGRQIAVFRPLKAPVIHAGILTDQPAHAIGRWRETAAVLQSQDLLPPFVELVITYC